GPGRACGAVGGGGMDQGGRGAGVRDSGLDVETLDLPGAMCIEEGGDEGARLPIDVREPVADGRRFAAVDANHRGADPGHVLQAEPERYLVPVTLLQPRVRCPARLVLERADVVPPSPAGERTPHHGKTENGTCAASKQQAALA